MKSVLGVTLRAQLGVKNAILEIEPRKNHLLAEVSFARCSHPNNVL